MSRTRDEYQSIRLGDIDGFVVKYNTTTSVTITSGSCEANGEVYLLASDTTKGITSTGDELLYIYIDDSASSPPAPTFVVAANIPSWSDSKRGFYNGNDRCIGSVWTDVSGDIIYFDTQLISNKVICNRIGRGNLPQMASSMNPTGAWQTPDDNDGSVVTPVNAIAIYLRLYNTDVGGTCSIFAASSEMAAVETVVTAGSLERGGYNNIGFHKKIPLGASRNIKIGGPDDDDNNLSCWCVGYDILR